MEPNLLKQILKKNIILLKNYFAEFYDILKKSKKIALF